MPIKFHGLHGIRKYYFMTYNILCALKLPGKKKKCIFRQTYFQDKELSGYTFFHVSIMVLVDIGFKYNFNKEWYFGSHVHTLSLFKINFYCVSKC
jgi:hypothetical protein